MLSAKIISVLLSLRALFIGCCPVAPGVKQDSYAVASYAKMDRHLVENSGLEYAGEGNFWVIKDSGGPASVFKIDAGGKELEEYPLKLKNQDWEDLAADPYGNLYIGDFGNNQNRRKQLHVYKWNVSSGSIDTLTFIWADQELFPPEPGKLNYDCEAFFWHQDSLHFFTKARGNKEVVHYAVPDQAGAYTPKPLERVSINGLVTAADISPDNSSLVLLTYGNIYLFGAHKSGKMLADYRGCFDVPFSGQSEAVVFITNTSMVISNESGKLFYLNLQK